MGKLLDQVRRTLAERMGKQGIDDYAANRGGDDWGPPSEASYGVAVDVPSPPKYEWPAAPEAMAYHGLAGEIVQTIDPHTEADGVAILVQTLIAFGSMIGRSAHFEAEGGKHFTNEFAVLVGQTSKGRKGSSWDRVRQVLVGADAGWAENCVVTGLSSGEGLIHHVRDALVKDKDGERETVDEGVADKRLLSHEAEFASVLKQVGRKENILSSVVRQAWETGSLRTLTKTSPTRATNAHVSIVGHCTDIELRRYLTETEIANGLGNRFLWFCVRRSKCLPDGGNLQSSDLGRLQQSLRQAVDFARKVELMRRDGEARKLWRRVYPELSEGRPGLAGSLLARAEAHVMRLACIYALLDQCGEVKAVHLQAALALWAHCERSVRFVFGDSLGDPLADELIQLLRSNPEGVTRNGMREYFARNKSSEQIGRALGLLQQCKLARYVLETTGGRPGERWHAVTP